MGNLVRGVLLDVLGSLRAFSSNSEDSTLHLWASPTGIPPDCDGTARSFPTMPFLNNFGFAAY
jgi:hypothetical protein